MHAFAFISPQLSQSRIGALLKNVDNYTPIVQQAIADLQIQLKQKRATLDNELMVSVQCELLDKYLGMKQQRRLALYERASVDPAVIMNAALFMEKHHYHNILLHCRC